MKTQHLPAYRGTSPSTIKKSMETNRHTHNHTRTHKAHTRTQSTHTHTHTHTCTHTQPTRAQSPTQTLRESTLEPHSYLVDALVLDERLCLHGRDAFPICPPGVCTQVTSPSTIEGQVVDFVTTVVMFLVAHGGGGGGGNKVDCANRALLWFSLLLLR